MDVRREIVFPTKPAEVWEALTEPERLEDWFATEVELEPRPGGRGTFRWGNGEERSVSVEEVDPERLLTLRWEDDGGEVVFTLEPVPEGTRLVVVESAPEWSTALELRALRRMRGRVDAVFQALADPHRRFVLETLAGSRLGDGDRARGGAARHEAGRGEAPRHAARAPSSSSRPGPAERPATAYARAARRRARLDGAGRHAVGRAPRGAPAAT